jgi:hypothetical protein
MIPAELQLRLALIAAVLAAIGAAIYFGVRLWQRHSRRKALLLRLERIAYDAAHQVLVPDGMGGFIHIDHLLLTQKGLVVLDTRRVVGVIFGGDQMSEWTVMSRKQRFTFDNPQPSLYDRVAAVKMLAGDAPVEGRLVFSNQGKFTKGMPKWVLMLDDLEVEFPLVNRSARSAPQFEKLNESWARVKSQLRPSPHAFTSL